MKRPQSITSKLKNTDIEIKNYLLQLEKENEKLQKSIAKFRVKDVSQQHEISALKKFQPKPGILKIIYPPDKDKNKQSNNTKK
jgi:hypothetical protein